MKNEIAINKEIENLKKPQETDYYVVNGKKQPGCRIVNLWSKDMKISTETIECVKNNDIAKASVRAWIGDKQKPIAEETCTIVLNFKQEMERLLTDHIINQISRKKLTENDFIFIPDQNGMLIPRLTNPEKHLYFWREWQRFLTFAERNAETKAKRRAQLSLMGIEYRDDEEIMDEKLEIEMVAEAKSKNIKHNTKVPLPAVDTKIDDLRNIVKRMIRELHLSQEQSREISNLNFDGKSFMQLTESDLMQFAQILENRKKLPQPKQIENNDIDIEIEQLKDILLQYHTVEQIDEAKNMFKSKVEYLQYLKDQIGIYMSEEVKK